MKKMFLMMAVALTTCLLSCSQKEAQQEKAQGVQEQADGTTSATPKANAAMSPEDFVAYLESCGHYFLATMDGDQPRVRPFSFCDVINGEVYFMTRKHKDVYKQLVKNPKVQIAAFPKEGRGWMRITCKLVEAETPEVRTHFLDKYPSMKEAHPVDDPDYAFMKLVGITAVQGKNVYSIK
ncbi:MAG: pyridoxamine 5'-phosphate oxidase family protein [Bacteroidaceae bacterium]|nr:pyridoxamine 5'-phosphate oxidase family protein [Bacteroidaceae bacterium]